MTTILPVRRCVIVALLFFHYKSSWSFFLTPPLLSSPSVLLESRRRLHEHLSLNHRQAVPAARRRRRRPRSLLDSRTDDFDPETSGGAYRVHRIDRLASWLPDGDANVRNPLLVRNGDHVHESYFVGESEAVIKSVVVDAKAAAAAEAPPPPFTCFKRAGPHLHNYFKADEVTAAVVTCGGLCPGLNTVVREVVTCLSKQYGVKKVWGVTGGYRGFFNGPGSAADTLDDGKEEEEEGHHSWVPLTPNSVDQIHTMGGTVLGTGRGGHDTERIVDSLEAAGVNQLFVIGGDGTMRGASLIANEVKRRGLRIAVAGIPKTVDNDIPIIDKSFGFDTAVEEARKAITSAHVEAESFPNGVGVVQLMGRNSGFIALHASLSSRDVDCVLIPEVDFDLPQLLSYLESRLLSQGHVVVVVAEGCAKHVQELDDSSCDVGMWLCEKVKAHFKAKQQQSSMQLDDNHNEQQPLLTPPSLKYLNPTYMVRSLPSNAADNVYCTALAHASVHGAFNGLTNFMVGPINTQNAYIPLDMLFNRTNVVAVTKSEVWARALFSTGQPDFQPSASIAECDLGSDTATGGCTVDLIYTQ